MKRTSCSPSSYLWPFLLNYQEFLPLGKNKDIFGKAIKAFFRKKDETDIVVHSPDFEDDVIPVTYLFRSYSEMPPLEQSALNLCHGNVLDVGCGAGSHSLYLQKQKHLNCLAIDTSHGAIEIAKARGVKNAKVQDFFDLEEQKFDTILMLMNGSGIIGKLDRLSSFFSHCKKILNTGGQIIMDSSDLVFLFNEEDFNARETYYGELKFSLSYNGETSDSFNWLYIDPQRLAETASNNKFSCEIVQQGEHYDYLAVLKPF